MATYENPKYFGLSAGGTGEGAQIGQTAGGTIGQAAGTYYGGPIGGMAGQYVGSLAGGYFGGLFDSNNSDNPSDPNSGANQFSTIQDLYGQAYGMLPGIAGSTVAYNQALAPGLFATQLGVEKQFDPNVAALRAATSRSILNELNLGNQVPLALQDLVTTNALQGNSASGLGGSSAGQLFGARSLLSAGLDLAARRRAESQGYVRSSPLPSQLYQIQYPFGQTPGNDIVSGQSQMEQGSFQRDLASQQLALQQQAQQAQHQQSTFSSLLNMAGSSGGISGGGGGYGGGGSSIGGPNYGIGAQSGGGGGGSNQGFSKIMGMFNGNGMYSAGTGGQYQNASGGFTNSTQAQGLNWNQVPNYSGSYYGGY